MPLDQGFYDVLVDALPAASNDQLTSIHGLADALMLKRGLRVERMFEREVAPPTAEQVRQASQPPAPPPVATGVPAPAALRGPWTKLVALDPNDRSYRKVAYDTVGRMSKGDKVRIGTNIRPMYLQNQTGTYIGSGLQHGDKILRIGIALDYAIRKYRSGHIIWVPVNALEVYTP